LPQFNPAQSLDRFTVIGIPLSLPGDPATVFRKLVVLTHFPDELFLVAVAPITRTQPYVQDPDLAGGCVLYQAREVPGFAAEVVIEPRQTHRHALAYAAIQQAMSRGTFQEFGPLPADFQARFLTAIKQNRLLNKKEKETWRALVC
jgi:hypothetical protein